MYIFQHMSYVPKPQFWSRIGSPWLGLGRDICSGQKCRIPAIVQRASQKIELADRPSTTTQSKLRHPMSSNATWTPNMLRM